MRKKWIVTWLGALALASLALAQDVADNDASFLEPGRSTALAPTEREDVWRLAHYTAQREWELGEPIVLLEQVPVEVTGEPFKPMINAEEVEEPFRMTVVTGRAQSQEGGQPVYVVGMLMDPDPSALPSGFRLFQEAAPRTSNLEDAKTLAIGLERFFVEGGLSRVVQEVMHYFPHPESPESPE